MSVTVETKPAAPAGTVDLEPEFIEIYRRVQPYTMVDLIRLHALYQAVRYIVAHDLPGDFVECGVCKGGCCMLMALTLRACGGEDRRIWLYDTFAGMPQPDERDVSIDGRKVAGSIWREKDAGDRNAWCYASLDEVRANLASTGYDAAKLVFVRGRVQDTIPGIITDRIALLRLDTDWYESTAHEMEHLYPQLVPGGVLISDDYGHWRGHREAIDGYFRLHGAPPLLTRTTCGAIGVKPG